VVFPQECKHFSKSAENGSGDVKLLASVSSFGYSGTIACVVLSGSEGSFVDRESANLAEAGRRKFPLLKRSLPNFSYDRIWDEYNFDVHLHTGVLRAFLADHVVGGRIVFPAVGFLELAIRCILRFGSYAAVEISGFVVDRFLKIPQGGGSLVLKLNSSGAFRFLDRNRDIGSITTFCQGNVNATEICTSQLNAVEHVMSREVTGEQIYDMLASVGLQYGPTFKLVKRVSMSSNGKFLVGEISSVTNCSSSQYAIPPPLLDAMFHCVAACGILDPSLRVSQVPYAINRALVNAIQLRSLPNAEVCYLKIQILSISTELTVFDCELETCDGYLLLRFEEVHVRAVDTVHRSAHKLCSHWTDIKSIEPSRVMGHIDSSIVVFGLGRLVSWDQPEITSETSRLIAVKGFDLTGLEAQYSHVSVTDIVIAVGKDENGTPSR
jgi:acyl transferase domain-containing protein